LWAGMSSESSVPSQGCLAGTYTPQPVPSYPRSAGMGVCVTGSYRPGSCCALTLS
jgi:hypothetical protein